MKVKSLVTASALSLILSSYTGCGKGDTEKLKDEVQAEREKRKEVSEKHKEALSQLSEEKKRANKLEKILLELSEKLEEEGKPVTEAVARLRDKKERKVQDESESKKAIERLLIIGNNLYTKGDYAGAGDAYSAAVELGSQDVPLHLRLCKCFIETQDYDKAISQYAKVLEILDEKAPKEQTRQVYNNLGWLYTQQKKYREAETAYLKAVKTDPSYANAYYNLGLLYDKYLRDELAAVDCFEKYIDLKGERTAYVQKRLAEIREK
ncbi:MAG TPA: tetratricopeptide repeat protein [Candidatus Hypogeohydataceae bacterium YC38]